MSLNGNTKYDPIHADHKRHLALCAQQVGTFSREELKELSDAMKHHGVRLGHLVRALRSYAQSPFGKYFCMERY